MSTSAITTTVVDTAKVLSFDRKMKCISLTNVFFDCDPCPVFVLRDERRVLQPYVYSIDKDNCEAYTISFSSVYETPEVEFMSYVRDMAIQDKHSGYKYITLLPLMVSMATGADEKLYPYMNEIAMRYAFWWTLGVFPPLPTEREDIAILRNALRTLRFRENIPDGMEYLLDSSIEYVPDRMSYVTMLNALLGEKLNEHDVDILNNFTAFFEYSPIPIEEYELVDKSELLDPTAPRGCPQFNVKNGYLYNGNYSMPLYMRDASQHMINEMFAHVCDYICAAGVAASGIEVSEVFNENDDSEMNLSDLCFKMLASFEHNSYFDLYRECRKRMVQLLDRFKYCYGDYEHTSKGHLPFSQIEPAAIAGGFGIFTEGFFVAWTVNNEHPELVDEVMWQAREMLKSNKAYCAARFKNAEFVTYLLDVINSGKLGPIFSRYENDWAKLYGVDEVLKHAIINEVPTFLLRKVLKTP